LGTEPPFSGAAQSWLVGGAHRAQRWLAPASCIDMAQPQGVIVLEDTDEERDATLEEVREYAEFLGIDSEKETHLMWIAKEGVVAKVPPPWKACIENGGDDVFYFNFETGESVWEHPCDEIYRKMVEEHRAKIASGASPDAANKAGSDSGSGLDDVETDEELAEEERRVLEKDPRDVEARVHSMMWDTTPNPSPQGGMRVADLSRESPTSGGPVRDLNKDLKEEAEKAKKKVKVESDSGPYMVDENYSPTLRGSRGQKMGLGSLKEEDEDIEEDTAKSSAASSPASTFHGPEADAKLEAQQKRLQLITNELSDDESLSRSSTPLNDSISSAGTGRSAANSTPAKASPSSPAVTCTCGNKFASDASFCRKCGRRRPEVAMVCSCGNDFLPDATFCRKCGRKRMEVESTASPSSSPTNGKMSRRAQEVSSCASLTIQRVWRGQRVRAKYRVQMTVKKRLNGQGLVGNRFDSGAIKLRHGERNLRCKERAHGPQHPEVAQALMQVAEQHKASAASSESAGRVAAMQRKQVDALERALRILEEHHGHASEELIEVLTRLAGAHKDLGGVQAEQGLLKRIDSIRDPPASTTPTAGRGSAGVGLAASPLAGLTVDTLLDENVDVEDLTEDTIQSSPTSANLSNTPSHSHSGGRNIPAGPGKAAAAARQLLGLEHSGQSGQSGKSSNLSEVSEDFPSDFDVPSPELTSAALGAGFGDSLELSATGTLEEGVLAAAAAATAAVPNPALAATAVAKVAGAAPLGGADKDAVIHNPVQVRMQSVKSDVESLARVLSALREIRMQQSEYLQGLKSLAEGSPPLLS